ncbi:MAG TPA: hypothetical protein VF503_16015 [Sphingobium sp.]|uniref:hypothetical protein n=1 Tax=Sphingobium sp. TaxID=1912891 RepID=UPI002ED4266B
MKLFIAAMAAGTVSVSASAAPVEDAVKRYIDGGFTAMDVNKNGQVDRAEFDQFMRARLARQAAAFDAAFAQMDKNANGSIDRAEAAANSALLENFDAVDADKDGGLTKDELRSAMIAAQAAEAGTQ